jgi:uncharacterized membrane protein
MTLVAIMKALHIAGLTLWMGGLLALPTMFHARMRFRDRSEAMHEWHRFTRAVFVGVVSPAAFVAIGTGAALIFLRGLFVEWMFLKLATVGVLVALHVWAGHVILHVFREGRRYPRWRQAASTTATAAAAGATLLLVLGKPDLSLDVFPARLMSPGGLQSLAPIIVPMP